MKPSYSISSPTAIMLILLGTNVILLGGFVEPVLRGVRFIDVLPDGIHIQASTGIIQVSHLQWLRYRWSGPLMLGGVGALVVGMLVGLIGRRKGGTGGNWLQSAISIASVLLVLQLIVMAVRCVWVVVQ